jgi:osmoprotectant transport system permease protein
LTAWSRAAAVALFLVGAPDGVAAESALRVGSKSFTESVILGEIVAQAARAAGVPVEHRAGLGGTRLVWNGLETGEIDVYPEYTGTIVEEILSGERPAAGQPSETWLRERLAARGLVLSAPLGFDNSYALAMPEALAGRLGVRSISDLRRHSALRLGFSSEFMNRREGWPSLRERYRLPHREVRGLEHDLAYRGLASGALDVTDAYTTDPQIRRHGLRLLRDDLGLFPRYDAVLVYRADAPGRWPTAFRAIARLEGAIDTATMADLNGRAQDGGLSESAAATFFLGRRGIAAPPAAVGRIGRILGYTAEHLELVGVSLTLAIAVAIPLGVLAFRHPGLGQAVLAVVGVIQTIPSLALLVFMIPLLGIGTIPATVALFLYSLLPIVRNTHAGLASIPPSVRESAEALGLPPMAILRLVELPMAGGSILAGIKSAAVINVGTATLGALIGAGGLGQPILTGIRLDDVGLVLEGAVPAALLALLVQGLFDLTERALVPRGLRLTAED